MMVTARERELLRELAKKQRDIASLPVMAERRARWYRLNDGDPREALVTFEFNGPHEEIYPVAICADPLARAVEHQMNMQIINHELLDDDRVVPETVSVRPHNSFLPYGIEPKRVGTSYADGRTSMGYAIEYAVTDLEQDFHKLVPSPFSVDAGLQGALRDKAAIEELIGDILPVQIQFPSFGYYPSYVLTSLMGMERVMLSMYDHPALLHRALRMLTDETLAYMKEIEDKAAILPNNDGSHLSQGSWGYTHDLPSREEIGGAVLFRHVWGYSNSQETVGFAPEMFDEFFFTYIEEFARQFGLFAYGCCEPVDEIWDLCLSRLPNLRKLSVSPWCDEEAIAERIRGKKIVYHRKPSPNYVSVADTLDEEAFGAHIAKTVIAARGCPLEITFRDVLTARGEPQRLTRAIAIVRKQFDRYWRPG